MERIINVREPQNCLSGSGQYYTRKMEFPAKLKNDVDVLGFQEPFFCLAKFTVK